MRIENHVLNDQQEDSRVLLISKESHKDKI